ncbi:MAG TPA: UDP-N-acetylmuramoyl-L-alanyl-D-glutamate--2,6-diaminopimelate ligase [Acidiferrobacteraceae bacterium]|nr:UDP-N-acetylmuramoyl-L-alanyl-D-glutamate--2,6-diaminopimelate ligase [Acidiferrobacteraceae bacterium]
MARTLIQLLEGVTTAPTGVIDMDIAGVTLDSRQVQEGFLFLAYSGEHADGRDYIMDAIGRGATAVAYEARDEALTGLGIATIPVRGLRQQAGKIAEKFYGHPSSLLTMIGITGTNGKTTCAHLLAEALDEPAARCGVIGTLGNGFPGQLSPGAHTTPDPVSLHKELASLVSRRAKWVCMEVSSHGMAQGRVEGVEFDVAVLTNLSRDHLDYHGDMRSYGLAKARLFEWPGLKHAVINVEDPFGQNLIQGLDSSVTLTRYGLEKGDVYALDLDLNAHGVKLHVTTPQGEEMLHSTLIGRFNASNLLAVLACLLALGVDLGTAVQRLAHSTPVAGRLERFSGGENSPLAVVDFAHTPEALRQTLEALREHIVGRLLCVFGCGGDRDRGKRPVMGRIAEQLADVVVLTDDNPRHESPPAIIADIRSGMHSVPIVIHDRVDAISWAIHEAGEDDLVLIAGKGHEQTQQIGDDKLPLSDRETVSRFLGVAA